MEGRNDFCDVRIDGEGDEEPSLQPCEGHELIAARGCATGQVRLAFRRGRRCVKCFNAALSCEDALRELDGIIGLITLCFVPDKPTDLTVGEVRSEVGSAFPPSFHDCRPRSWRNDESAKLKPGRSPLAVSCPNGFLRECCVLSTVHSPHLPSFIFPMAKSFFLLPCR